MVIPKRTKWLGELAADPSPAEIEEGSWWYNTTEKRWKFFDGSEIRALPIKIKEAVTPDLTIPIGGGSATASVTIADLGLSTRIEWVVDVEVERRAPVVNDVYAPSYGVNATGDAIGLTVAAGTGTTLAVRVVALGY